MQAADFKALLAQRQLHLPFNVQENAASYLLVVVWKRPPKDRCLEVVSSFLSKEM